MCPWAPQKTPVLLLLLLLRHRLPVILPVTWLPTVQSGMVSRAAQFMPKAALWLPVVFRTHAGTLDPMRARLVFLTHADR